MDCPTGKKRYPRKKDAATVRNSRMRGRSGYRRNRPKALRIYCCPDCGGWHLTHKI